MPLRPLCAVRPPRSLRAARSCVAAALLLAAACGGDEPGAAGPDRSGAGDSGGGRPVADAAGDTTTDANTGADAPPAEDTGPPDDRSDTVEEIDGVDPDPDVVDAAADGPDEPACTPGLNTCDGRQVVACNPDGTLGVVIEDCAPGECANGVCLGACGDGKTYVGCEFWGADLDHWQPGDGQQYAISVSNPSAAAVDVTIRNGAGDDIQSATIAAGALSTFRLPRQDVDHTSRSFRSYVVEATGPVSAHQFNPLNQSGVASNDASLLLPTPTLGREYIVLGWPTVSSGRVADGRSYMTVIATAADTEVTVTPAADIEANGGLSAITGGTPSTFTLARGEVLSLGTARVHGRDLTGSRISASKPVAVFFGHECADIPLGTCCCDHIEQQMLPVEAWGRSVVAAKFEPRGTEDDLWRVVAAEDGTSVTLTPAVGGVAAFTLDAGQVRELLSATPFVIEADAPVLAGQFLTGANAPRVGRRGCAGFLAGNAGDPAYTLNVPTEQWLDSYVVLTPEGFSVNHLTIVTSGEAAIELDGGALSSPRVEVPGTPFVLYRPQVTPGVHRVSGDAPFGLYAYGFDCYVSYAYPGGLQLRE